MLVNEQERGSEKKWDSKKVGWKKKKKMMNKKERKTDKNKAIKDFK